MNNNTSQKIIRRHMIFYGRVQGVGFRYTAYYSAMKYGISGWVRNLHDGSVEMEAEGTERDIDSMLLDIDSSRYIRIEEMKAKTIPPTGENGFSIDR